MAALLPPLSLIVLVLALFGQILSHQLVWDDQDNIVENPALRQPLFSGSLLASPTAPTRFLTNLSFAVEYRLWGLAPIGYHAVNLLLHLINSLLVYLLALRIWARWRGSAARASSSPPSSGRLGAWTAGVLFAVHPVHVETVNSIALGRGYLLSTAFGLTAIWLVTAGDWRAWRWVGLTVTLVGAVLSHELGLSAIVLAAAVWLICRRSVARTGAPGGIETAGLVLMGGGLAALLVWAVVGGGREGWGAASVLQSALLAVKQLIAPVPLCLWYDAGILHDPSSADVLVVAAVAFAGLLFGLTAWLRDLRVVWCLMLFGLSLMAVLVRHFLPFPLPSLLGERWLYWPSAFLAVCVGLLIQRMREGAGREMARRTVSVWAAIGLFLAVSAVAAFYTAAQVRAWRDNVALFERAVQSCPPSAYLRSALGKHYFDRQQVAQAREEFMTALSIDPDFPRARIGLGLIDLANNDLQEAFRNFTLARILAPSDANVHNGLGEIYFRTGQYETAIAEFQQAATLRPANAVYFWNLALSLMKVGRYQDAIPAWERVLAASPDSEERETAAEEIRLLKRRLPDGP